jgi:transcription elongation factor Elf1
LQEQFASANALTYGHMKPMQTDAEIVCPFCGQTFELAIDTGIARQHFITDCEICCRPMEVKVEASNGELLSLQVSD